MFKKKANLPARPTFPRNPEIFEDLALAKDTDAMLTNVPSSTGKFPKIVDISTELPSKIEAAAESNNDLDDPEKCYRKVKTFDEKVEYAENHIEVLKEQHRVLSELKQNLLEDIEKVKKDIFVKH